VDVGPTASQVVGEGEQVAARMELRLILDADRARDGKRQ
jgi:hypothetical protein